MQALLGLAAGPRLLDWNAGVAALALGLAGQDADQLDAAGFLVLGGSALTAAAFLASIAPSGRALVQSLTTRPADARSDASVR